MKNEHWTDDPELVELFVSGTLRPDQEKVFESHLEQCATCRAITDREAVLREGIRIYARNSLKSRLRTRVALSSPAAIPWPHIISAAAVLVIIVGIGIQTGLWKNAELTLKDADVGRMDTVRSLGHADVEPGASPEEVGELVPAESVEESRAEEIDEMEAAASIRRERALSVSPPSAEIAKSQVEPPGGIVWVTGKILTEQPRTAFRAEKKIAAAAEDQASFQMRSKDVEGPRMTVSQKPLQMLPSGQQQVGLTGLREVMTALEEKDDSIHMTIFTDDMEVQSQPLQIMPITDDSIIVTAGKARIAFKFPSSMKGKVH